MGVDFNSDVWRIFLIILSAILTFTGPTYIVTALVSFNVNYGASMILGLLLFIVGLAVTLWLVRKKVIS
ncbi:MAG: hypothetical protein N3F10_03740 [Candidatus Bathyarchaeota archaeon]|nr:hypothetical protein [Candidatus Bathyarchaeota archaeon]MCX8177392.1 hypothetical protein [Candidatus Bathyarchaeota archaeon]MDW8193839.1 hypothetical protein [Nitrososphaerota archaeon]